MEKKWMDNVSVLIPLQRCKHKNQKDTIKKQFYCLSKIPYSFTVSRPLISSTCLNICTIIIEKVTLKGPIVH